MASLLCFRAGSLAMYPIWDFGSEEQKEKYLQKWPLVNGLVVLV